MYLIPIVLFVIVWMWPRLWSRFIYGKIEATITVSKQEVKVGETVSIQVSIRNRSWLPCPYVEVNVPFPAGLSADEDGEVKCLRYVSYMNLRQQLDIDLDCYAQARGKWSFTTIGLQMNEGFGLQTQGHTLTVQAHIVVLPKTLDIETTRLQFKELLGRVEVARWLHPDESLLRGIREYQSGDSFKHISWTTTAKSGTWMTKQFSSSTETMIHLVLNAQLTDPFWSGTLHDEFDFLCSLATTYAIQFESLGCRIEFSTNAWIADGHGKKFRFGEQRAQSIRSFLGRATSFPNAPFDVLLRVLSHVNSSQPAPVIIFTSYLTAQQALALRQLTRRGREVFLVLGPSASSDLLRLKDVTVVHHLGLGAVERGQAVGEQ